MCLPPFWQGSKYLPPMRIDAVREGLQVTLNANGTCSRRTIETLFFVLTHYPSVGFLSEPVNVRVNKSLTGNWYISMPVRASVLLEQIRSEGLRISSSTRIARLRFIKVNMYRRKRS